MRKAIITTIIATLALSLFATPNNNPNDNAQYGFKMLQIAPSAASMATAGAGRLNINDPFNFLISPEITSLNKTKSVAANQTMWLFDTNISSVAISSFSNTSATAFGVRWLDYGKIDEVDMQMQKIGDLTPIDIDAAFNYSKRFGANHFAGFNVHFLYEKLASNSAIGLCADFGYSYLTPIKGLSVGATLKNIGETGKMNKEKIDLPKSYGINLLHKLDISPILKLSSEVQGYKIDGEDDFKLDLACAFLYKNMVNVKAGYKVNHDSIDFSAGLGFIFSNFTFDYAFVNTIEDLDAVHSFSVGYLF